VTGRGKWLRWGLGAAGVAGIAFGLLGLPGDLGPPQLIGLLGWLAAAVVLHDGVLVALSTLAGAGLKRFTFGLGTVSQVILRATLLCGAAATLVVVPLLKAQQEVRTLTVDEGPYALALGIFWLALVVLAAAAIAAVELRLRKAARASAHAA
jgi:hypothetical protein